MIAFAHPTLARLAARCRPAAQHTLGAQRTSAAQNKNEAQRNSDAPGESVAPGKSDQQPEPAWHSGFLALLPDIRRHVCFAFRRLSGERREEAVQEAVANALVAYIRLHESGRTELAYASPLAHYAVRQVRGGRQIACPLNACETLSPYAQRKAGFTVSRLHWPDETAKTWKELLVEDRSCTPGELAASRLDFDAWWRRLPRRKRRVAAALAAGSTTGEIARRFKLSAGRISQLRRELARDWSEFLGEPEPK